jgi:hypothetical protein
MPTEINPTNAAMTDTEAAAEARRIIADFATSYRDDHHLPAIGTTPPVPQPGRPPMSQGATDASVLMLSGSVATVLVGGAVSLVMWTSGHADPTVCGIVFGAPAATILALSRLVKRAKGVLPDEHHHHYTGPVDQRTVHTSTRGVWAKTNNQR